MLPHRVLCWIVRDVFVSYGDKMDALKGKRLLNDRAWSKAKTVLKDILMEKYIDPLNMTIYVYHLSTHNEPKK